MSKNKKPATVKIPARETEQLMPCPVVGIGASAGGLEALEQFFQNMPEASGLAFVVIQHLDPTHIGIMPELLQRQTEMHVIQATDGLRVKPDSVYVIPPNKSMSFKAGKLCLFSPLESRGKRLPIDFFLLSLAESLGDLSVAIILSGMGSDGSIGARAIKKKGGLILVQSPDNAKFSSMPESALSTADIVAAAQELPTALMQLLKEKKPDRQESQPEINQVDGMERIIKMLQEKTGHDFTSYKKNTLWRRIERRMGAHQFGKTAEYVEFLRDNPQERELLFKEFLIGVTGFFRDAAVWEKLKAEILPGLLSRVSNNGVLRGWVPGCSTGEEAFTLAITICEILESLGNNNNLSVQIFATDLDTVAIEKARRGIYSENALNALAPQQIKRFFIREGDAYRIHTAIREMVVFAPQNVIKDPPFTKLDFISCRNLLIYLEPDLQKKLLDLFYYSLRIGGILLLGSAESSGLQETRFSTIDSKLRIYQKPEAAPQVDLSGIPYSFFQTTKTKVEVTLPEKNMDNIQALTDALLLQKFTPPSVLVNDKGDILYITGRIGKFLEPAAGKVNMNIFAMAREGLRGLLLTSFRKIEKSIDPIILKKVNVGGTQPIVLADVTMTRITTTGPLYGFILVVFSELPESGRLKTQKSGKAHQEVNSHFDEVEDELRRCREELLGLREEMQSSQEELRSTNEELLSTNEELQSTNEELTTSKEELQSLNEELQTVNMELQCKVDDYERIHNDMKNLLDSIEIATLFLDKGLNIRRFTKQLTGIYKVIDSDIGRPFTDLVSSLDYPQIEQEAGEVLQTRVAKEKSVMSHDGRWFSVRIMPYRTDDERVEGLVITFMNISYTKKLEIELQDRIALLNSTSLRK